MRTMYTRRVLAESKPVHEERIKTGSVRETPGATLSKLLRKIFGRFLILGQSLTISENKPGIISLYLLTHDLSTTSRNNIKHDSKIKALITIIIALLSLIRD